MVGTHPQIQIMSRNKHFPIFCGPIYVMLLLFLLIIIIYLILCKKPDPAVILAIVAIFITLYLCKSKSKVVERMYSACPIYNSISNARDMMSQVLGREDYKIEPGQKRGNKRGIKHNTRTVPGTNLPSPPLVTSGYLSREHDKLRTMGSIIPTQRDVHAIAGWEGEDEESGGQLYSGGSIMRDPLTDVKHSVHKSGPEGDRQMKLLMDGENRYDPYLNERPEMMPTFRSTDDPFIDGSRYDDKGYFNDFDYNHDELEQFQGYNLTKSKHFTEKYDQDVHNDSLYLDETESTFSNYHNTYVNRLKQQQEEDAMKHAHEEQKVVEGPYYDGTHPADLGNGKFDHASMVRDLLKNNHDSNDRFFEAHKYRQMHPKRARDRAIKSMQDTHRVWLQEEIENTAKRRDWWDNGYDGTAYLTDSI